jgi:threonine synthase
MSVSDQSISEGLDEVAKREGFLLCPEGAATYAAWKQSLAQGLIESSDRCVLFNCASGVKYPLPPADETIDCRAPIDYECFRK